MGDGFVGSPHVAGLQQPANLDESQANQRAAERINAFLGRLQLFGLQQIAPGAFDILSFEAAFAALDVGTDKLGQQFAGRAVIADGRLGQQAMGLFQTPVFERFARLPNCQPCEAEHFLPFLGSAIS
jgi:hypothetical protein